MKIWYIIDQNRELEYGLLPEPLDIDEVDSNAAIWFFIATGSSNFEIKQVLKKDITGKTSRLDEIPEWVLEYYSPIEIAKARMNNDP